MKNEPLVLKYQDKKTEFVFENKVSLIENKKLASNLYKPNIKNRNSELLIHSANDIHISDVTQIRVNLNETGTFLVNFLKKELSQERRDELLKEIGALKNEDLPTVESQSKKTCELLGILNKYEPLYVSFINNGTIKINMNECSNKELNFPLLLLPEKRKFTVYLKFHKNRNARKRNDKEERPSIPLVLFDTEYIFIFLFSLLGSFAITTTVFEILNKQTISIFLGIIALAFALVEISAMQSTTFKKNKAISPYLRYYLTSFIFVGVIGGIVGGYFVSKFVLKTEIENFDYKKTIIISSAISLVVMLSSVFSSILLNKIIAKIKKNKKVTE